MGWGSGSELAEALWDDIRKHIPEKSRKLLAKKFIKHFENHDCDTLSECTRLIKDADVLMDDEQ